MQLISFVAPLVAFAGLAAASGTAAGTTTLVTTVYTTYCPEPTTLVFKNKTITVTEATTLTITDCPCTLECYTPPVYTTTHNTVPYSNKTAIAPPVTITVTPTPVTVLQGCTTVNPKSPAPPPQTFVPTPATPVAPTTPAGTPAGSSPSSVVTAGANHLGSGAAVLGLAIGIAAMAL